MNQRYQAQFAKPLVNQLIAILQRDQQAALDIANATRPAGRALKPFGAFYKEAGTVQNWPALVLVAQEVAFDSNSDADLRTQSIRFICAMAITGTDPEWLAEDALDYLRVVDTVLTSAPLGDFYLPLSIDHRTVPDGETAGLDPNISKVQDLRIVRHDLGVLVTRARSAGLARGPQIEFVIEMEER
jgi:hypothetical protein